MDTGVDDLDHQLDPAVIARAEAALAALRDDYLGWVEADLGRLCRVLDRIRGDDDQGGEDCDRAAMEEMFAVAHDIKGQAATFGYPLLTELASGFCHLLRDVGGDGLLVRLELLVSAMVEVVTTRLEGDGGERGQALLLRSAGRTIPEG